MNGKTIGILVAVALAAFGIAFVATSGGDDGTPKVRPGAVVKAQATPEPLAVAQAQLSGGTALPGLKKRKPTAAPKADTGSSSGGGTAQQAPPAVAPPPVSSGRGTPPPPPPPPPPVVIIEE